MPRRQKNYKKNGRKNPRKKYARRKNKYQKAVITRMRGPGFADTVYARLTYVEKFSLVVASPIAQYVFRGNSCFDPNYTGTGHQPLYFDQYSAIYNKYRVVGSSIRVDVVNHSIDSAAHFAVFPSTDTQTFTSMSQVMEQGRARSPKIIPLSQFGPMPIVKTYCSSRKALGLTKIQMGDDTVEALIGQNPSQVWYWNIVTESTTSTVDIDQIYVVKIVYYVQFFDRAIVASS